MESSINGMSNCCTGAGGGAQISRARGLIYDYEWLVNNVVCLHCSQWDVTLDGAVKDCGGNNVDKLLAIHVDFLSNVIYLDALYKK